MTVLLNAARDASLNPQELRIRRAMKMTCGLVKLVAVAIAAVFAAIFVFNPGVFSFALAGAAAVAGHDLYEIGSSHSEILHDPDLERALVGDLRLDHLIKNTWLISAVAFGIRYTDNPL